MSRSLAQVVVDGFNFESAHMLKDAGKCSNLHGHSYQVEVCLNCFIKDSGIGEDFSTVKKVVEKVIEPLDHAYISKDYDEIVAVLTPKGMRVHILGMPPTAENLARYIYDSLVESTEFTRYHVEYVKVWETKRCSAVYKGECL